MVGALACSNERDSRAAAVPATAAEEEERALPERPVSRFDVPLQYDFTPQLALVERAIPVSFGSMDSLRQMGDNERKHYAFAASRGPFVAYARGREVYMRALFSYQARGYYKPPIGPTLSAGCGNDKQSPGIVLELVAPLTLTPDWHLKSTARIAQLSPASDSAADRCRVSILNLDVTDRVLEAARSAITAHLSDIDKKVSEIDLSKNASEWWASLQRPIRLADDVWLLLRPVQFRLGKIRGERQLLTADVGLDANPEIVTGDRPNLTVDSLPPLGSDSIPNAVRATVDGRLTYHMISRVFDKELKGKDVVQSGRTVTVRSVAVTYDSGTRIALSVTFTGDAKGTLRLVGTPALDVAHEYLMVPDLDYDLSTDSDLINAYTWLKSDELRLLIRNKARVPLAPILERGRSVVLKGLNRKIKNVITLTGTVDSVKVVGLYTTPRGLVVRGGMTGTAAVSIKPHR
ncbi:MAG TPA: DUF4403 family protein [Gemmatimonadaceae bacterium]|nr:DUF4403 family protein [Gemmatimonadaceae bacterium]